MEIYWMNEYATTQSDHLTYEWLRDQHACRSSNCTSNQEHKRTRNAVVCKSCMPDGMPVIRVEASKVMYTFMLSMKQRPDLIRPPKDIMKLIFEAMLSEYDLNLTTQTYCFMHDLDDVQHVVHRGVCDSGSRFHEMMSWVKSERNFFESKGVHPVRVLVKEIFGDAVEFSSRGIFIEQTKYKTISYAGGMRKMHQYRDETGNWREKEFSNPRLVDMKRPNPPYWHRRSKVACLHCGKPTTRKCSVCEQFLFCSPYCQVACVYIRASRGCSMRGQTVSIAEPRLIWKHSDRRINWKTFLHEWMIAYFNLQF